MGQNSPGLQPAASLVSDQIIRQRVQEGFPLLVLTQICQSFTDGLIKSQKAIENRVFGDRQRRAYLDRPTAKTHWSEQQQPFLKAFFDY
jgi:hypothetical protein